MKNSPGIVIPRFAPNDNILKLFRESWSSEIALIRNSLFVNRSQAGPLDIRQERRQQTHCGKIRTHQIHKINAGQIR
jgi:hypothetical protein